MAITINGSGTISGISTGGLPDGSVDADTLASGAGDGSIETFSKQFSYTSQSLGTTVTVGTFTLPSSGIWVINYQSRIGWSSMTAFSNFYLADSSNSAITTKLLNIEQISNGGTANIGQLFQFIVDVHNGNSTYEINVRCYIINRTTSNWFHQSDSNGKPGVTCFKIAESTTSGTGITNLGI